MSLDITSKIKKNPEFKISIRAGAEETWLHLSNFSAYPTWNSLLSFNQEPRAGEKIPMVVSLFGFKTTVPIEILTLSQTNGLSWVGGINKLITGEHYFYLRKIDDNNCVLIQGERFRGILVPLLWPLIHSTLNTLYNETNLQLKTFIENNKEQ